MCKATLCCAYTELFTFSPITQEGNIKADDVERWSRGRETDCQSRDGGSIPPVAISKLRQFRSPHICLCISEETLKAGDPFYLVSMPGEVKYITASAVCHTEEDLLTSL